jgi:PAS domain S-box-containing protein
MGTLETCASTRNGQKLRVLFVVDGIRDANPSIRQLERAGFALRADVVSRPKQFTKALRSKPYDVVLADYQLSSWSGTKALETLKGEGKDIPFIVVTSLLGEEAIVEVIKEGATDYVLKDRLARLPFAVKRALQEKERKQAESALEASETRYRRLFETAQDGILLLAETGTITDVNPYLLEMLGYSKAELVGRHLCDIGFVADSDLCQKTFRSLQQRGSIRCDGLPLEARSGKRMEVAFVSKVYLAGGKKVIQCNIRDITLHTRKIEELEQRVTERTVQLAAANKELAREHDLLHTLMDNVPDFIYFKDEANRFTRINQALAKAVGIDRPEDAVGKTDFDFFTPEYAQEALADEQKILRTGQPVIAKVEEASPPGRPSLWVSTTKMVIRDVNGNDLGTFGVSHDLTQSKQFERTLQEKNIELERAIVAKDKFLASMSHELRTPLTAVIGFTGTLLMKLPGPLTAEQTKQLQTVRSSAWHLLSLINDLLDLAKIESGKFTLTLEPVVLQSVVEEVCSTVRPLAEKTGLDLTEITPKEELVLNTDRRVVSQILLNLTSNAIRFTEHGEVCIVLGRQRDNGKSLIQVSVHDTGIGIGPEDQPKLFQVFSQVEGSLRRNEGSGLGLHLSQKLAGLLGGQINFKSECGKESTFTLSLPES